MEEWRPVVGYEKLYEVSDQGNVKRLSRRTINRVRDLHRGVTRLLNPYAGKTHYYVTLCDERGKQKYQVHTLVLEAFVGPRPEGGECRHLNANGFDNRLDNLDWGTKRRNMFDMVEHDHAHLAKFTADQVRIIRENYKGWRGEIVTLAAQHGVSRDTIANILHRKTWRTV